MAAAPQGVVDQLVVTLELDADQYKTADKQVNQLVDTTEKKAQQVDQKRKTREVAQQKRTKETTKGVKDLALGLRGLSLTIAGMIGVGSAAGIIGAVVAFTGMETSLRRSAVSTNLSNRQLQAWGSTARRLGADAQAGQDAIAGLAREQQQYALTGQAPTMTALSRIGVNVGANTSIVDMLAQAQERYRAAAPGQRQTMEATLAASGVSADLIVAIKSEKDVRTEYTRSLAEAATENRKALDSVTDALTGLATQAANIANSIATVVAPYVQQFADWVHNASSQISEFTDKVIAAGGGVDGFMKVLDKEAPELADSLRGLGKALDVLGQAVDVIVYGFQELGRAGAALFKWLDQKTAGLLGTGEGSHPLVNAVSTVGKAVAWAWNGMVRDARIDGAAPVGTLTGDNGGVRLSKGAAARIAGGALSGVPTTPRASGGGMSVGDMMTQLITQYGLGVNEAAGFVANAMRESGGNPAAFNPAGGGQGARGMFQWRGDRIKAFKDRYGVSPDQADPSQQLDFLFRDPYELHLARLAAKNSTTAQDYGTNLSRIFEGHGNVKEDARRGVLAQSIANDYSNSTQGQQVINIQSMTVKADSPQQLGTELTRQSGVQSYNSAVR